ncbi:S8 family serine peptidase, partial [Candidatus Nitrosotalea sp. FS]|uniref:S8 family serine peptidase n=1 Tax=Candidatus Nitrosotalea sp. FS TaxID=2341021 RepID=UPI001C49BA5B
FVDPPLQESNDMARVASNIEPLHREYNLSGDGVTALVYDIGKADSNHPDFGERIIEQDNSPVQEHATHVTGTLGGSGINSDGEDANGRENGGTSGQWQGMAPDIMIRSFGFASNSNSPPLFNDGSNMEDDFTRAILNGTDLATMSLNTNIISNGYDCKMLGDYVHTPVLIDKIVNGTIGGQRLLFFESVGNERQGSNSHCGQASTISPPASAKDSIAVGAINADNKSITGFTSFGPTKDGRLKPDIVAPGCTSNNAGIISTGLDKGYVSMCGTSMAAPIAAGAAALLIQEWHLIHEQDERPLPPHTVKAILIHTATDLGAPGPDYKFGWGALDAKSAIDLVRADKYEHLIKIDSVIEDQSNSYQIISDGNHIVKATLVWDDPAGTRLTSKNLVNDLDMRLTDPSGKTYKPFVLNPHEPERNAVRGNDDTNNVEMITGDASRGTWTLTVNGTSISDGTQEYTVITSEGPDEKTMTVSMDKSQYNHNDSATITVNSGLGPGQNIGINIVDPTGDIHPIGSSQTDSTGSVSLDFEIPADFPTGTYQLIANSESTAASDHRYMTFEVVPEFGPISAMVFVTAVIFTLFLTRARTVSKI